MSTILTIVLLIFLAILVIVVYLLISPFSISVDSKMNHYWIGWNRWMNARISGDNNKWTILMILPLWQKKIGIDDLISKDNEISFIATKAHSGLSAAFEKVPELIEKYMESKKVEPVHN